MKAFIAFVLTVITAAALSALGAYVSGRIVLPEMGLIAPGYLTWFWASLWVTTIYTGAKLIAEAVND